MIETAILCLALNIFHEGRNQSVQGQRAVAQVTMNRAGHDPARVCEEVFRPYQFSWTNNLRGNEERFMPYNEPAAWARAKQVARKAIAGRYRGRFSGADHYHRRDVSPAWKRNMRVVAVLGDHIFYRR